MWQDDEPDNTLPMNQLPTDTAQSANDCQLHSPTHYSKSHCGAWLVTYQSFQCKPLSVSLHALGRPGYCQLKVTYKINTLLIKLMSLHLK